MALILDTDNESFIAADAAGMARQLLGLLAGEPDDETLARLAATVLRMSSMSSSRELDTYEGSEIFTAKRAGLASEQAWVG